MGFTVLQELFTSSEIESLQSDYRRLHAEAMALVHQSDKARERVWMENDEETRSVYWRCDDDENEKVILQAGEGRYDLHTGFVSDTAARLARNPQLMRLMEVVLGAPSTFSCHTSFILSQPDSQDQYWHRDTDTFQKSGSDGSVLVHMEDFYFTVLVPITVDVTTLNGPTEFMVGSHKTTADTFAFLQRQQVCAPVGSALVFNGKINHRGMGNSSALERPILYFVFSKRWYNDSYRAGLKDDA